MQELVPAIGLGLMVVFAGCTLPTDLGAQSSTANDVERPPGIKNDRLADGSKLLEAHNRTVIDTGFKSDFRVNGTTTFNGSVVELHRHQRTRVEPGAVEYRYHVSNTGGSPEARFDYWGNRTTLAIRAQSSSGVQYNTGTPATPRTLANVVTLGTYVLASDFTVTSVNRTNKTVLFTLTADSASGLGMLLPENATNITNYHATLVVDREGRIHEFVATVDYTIDGQPGRMDIRYQLVRVGGIEVSRPNWVSKALNDSN